MEPPAESDGDIVQDPLDFDAIELEVSRRHQELVLKKAEEGLAAATTTTTATATTRSTISEHDRLEAERTINDQFLQSLYGDNGGYDDYDQYQVDDSMVGFGKRPNKHIGEFVLEDEIEIISSGVSDLTDALDTVDETIKYNAKLSGDRHKQLYNLLMHIYSEIQSISNRLAVLEGKEIGK